MLRSVARAASRAQDADRGDRAACAGSSLCGAPALMATPVSASTGPIGLPADPAADYRVHHPRRQAPNR